jgi:hypothetical protein
MVALRLGITIDYGQVDGDGAAFMASLPSQDDLLDVVDAILGSGGAWSGWWSPSGGGLTPDQVGSLRGRLAEILDNASSAYRINDDGNGLAVRVPETGLLPSNPPRPPKSGRRDQPPGTTSINPRRLSR